MISGLSLGKRQSKREAHVKLVPGVGCRSVLKHLPAVQKGLGSKPGTSKSTN